MYEEFWSLFGAGKDLDLQIPEDVEFSADEIEVKLNEADAFAKSTSERYSANEVFSRVKNGLQSKLEDYLTAESI